MKYEKCNRNNEAKAANQDRRFFRVAMQIDTKVTTHKN